MKQQLLPFYILDKDKAVSELIEFALWKGELIKFADGQYYWRDNKEYLGERTTAFKNPGSLHKCPECHEDDDKHPTKTCMMVYGRRGWRRLGDFCDT